MKRLFRGTTSSRLSDENSRRFIEFILIKRAPRCCSPLKQFHFFYSSTIWQRRKCSSFGYNWKLYFSFARGLSTHPNLLRQQQENLFLSSIKSHNLQVAGNYEIHSANLSPISSFCSPRQDFFHCRCSMITELCKTMPFWRPWTCFAPFASTNCETKKSFQGLERNSLIVCHELLTAVKNPAITNINVRQITFK